MQGRRAKIPPIGGEENIFQLYMCQPSLKSSRIKTNLLLPRASTLNRTILFVMLMSSTCQNVIRSILQYYWFQPFFFTLRAHSCSRRASFPNRSAGAVKIIRNFRQIIKLRTQTPQSIETSDSNELTRGPPESVQHLRL